MAWWVRVSRLVTVATVATVTVVMVGCLVEAFLLLTQAAALKSTDLLQRWLPKMGIDEVQHACDVCDLVRFEQVLRLRGQVEFPERAGLR